MFAVTVTFEIKPENVDRFLALVQENAQTSLRDEPGCQLFDICHTLGETTVFLYEIYDSKAAFDAHLASAHFKTFDAATARMVDSKDARLFEKVIR